MKSNAKNIKWLGLMASLAMANSAAGQADAYQGTIFCSNLGQMVNAPFFDNNGVLLSGTNYAAQLYAGLTPESLFPFGPVFPFKTGVNSGYLAGGTVVVPINVVPYCGAPVWAQVRAWRADRGATFEEAALWGAWTGISSVIYVPVTGGSCFDPPQAPAWLEGLQYPGSPIVVQEPPSLRGPPTSPHATWVVASGGVALSYQWYQGASGDIAAPIPGATNSYYQSLLTTNLTLWVRVRTSAGSVDSAAATLWLTPYAPGPLSIQWDPGLPKLFIRGTIGTTVQVQSSPDLNPAHWSVVTNLWQDVDPLVFVDATATNVSSRYYRLALP